MIARFAIGISNDITKVEVECDPTNKAAVDLVPPVMPMDPVKMRSLTFISEVIKSRNVATLALARDQDKGVASG
jgi:hypothetical protein